MKLKDLLDESFMDAAKAAVGMKTSAQKAQDSACKELMARAQKSKDITNGLDGGLTMIHNDAVKANCTDVVAFVKNKIKGLEVENAKNMQANSPDGKAKQIAALEVELKAAEAEASKYNDRDPRSDEASEKVSRLKLKIASLKK